MRRLAGWLQAGSGAQPWPLTPLQQLGPALRRHLFPVPATIPSLHQQLLAFGASHLGLSLAAWYPALARPALQKSSLINSVLPVVLIFLLGMFVFFIGERELASRLEVIVALFLALTGGAGVGFDGRVGGGGVGFCGERGLYVWVMVF